MPNQSSMDELKVKRGLLALFLVGVAVVLPFMALKTHNPLFYVLFFALPLAAWFISNPAAMLITLYFAVYAKVVLPGLPGGLDLTTLFQMLIVGWGILHYALTRKRAAAPKIPAAFLLFFMINMFLIIAVRGFGMGALGGDQYGGKAYILLLISFLFYFTAPQIDLTERHIRRLFWGALICSVIPAIVQASMYMTGGATWSIAQFFDLATRDMMAATLSGGEAENVRWSEVFTVARNVLLVALVVPSIRRRKLLSWGLIGVAVVLVLITGYRGELIRMGAMIFWWMVYNSKKRMETVGVFVALGMVGWLVALVVVPDLPFSMQRALSFLPLMSERISDLDALMQAGNSLDFRYEVWGYAWQEVSRYLLIGRGLLFDVTGWAWLNAGWYNQPVYFYASHAYHSGPLSLLIDFGIPGLITGAGFMIGVCVHAWRAVRQYCGRRTDLFSAFYVFLTIRFSYSALAFFLVYGSVKRNFPQMITEAVLLCVFQRELALRHRRKMDSVVTSAVELNELGDDVDG